MVEQCEREVISSIRGGDNSFLEVVWVVSRERGRWFRYPKITHISIVFPLPDAVGLLLLSTWSVSGQVSLPCPRGVTVKTMSDASPLVTGTIFLWHIQAGCNHS